MQLSPKLPSRNGQLQVRLYVRTGTRCAGTSNLLLQTPDPKTELPPAPSGNFLQLQEVRLFGDDGTQLPISSASNPMGASPNAQPPGDVIDNDLGYLLLADCSPVCCTFTLPSCTAHNNKDGDCDCGDECHCSRGSKWLDFNIATAQNMDGRANYNSTLLLTLAAPAHVAAYELITADDMMQRDPSSWTFYGQYDDTWVPLKTEEVVPPETRYTSYGISYLPRFLPPPTPPAPPPRFASMLPPAPGSVRPAPPPPPPPSPLPPPPSPPTTQDPTPRQPLLSPPPSVPGGLDDLDANSQQGPDQMSALVYVLAGCGATLLCLGVCSFALFCWCVHNRKVRAAVQHRAAPHRTAPRRTPPPLILSDPTFPSCRCGPCSKRTWSLLPASAAVAHTCSCKDLRTYAWHLSCGRRRAIMASSRCQARPLILSALPPVTLSSVPRESSRNTGSPCHLCTPTFRASGTKSRTTTSHGWQGRRASLHRNGYSVPRLPWPAPSHRRLVSSPKRLARLPPVAPTA